MFSLLGYNSSLVSQCNANPSFGMQLFAAGSVEIIIFNFQSCDMAQKYQGTTDLVMFDSEKSCKLIDCNDSNVNSHGSSFLKYAPLRLLVLTLCF